VNGLYFGDNLGWLRNTKEFPDASVETRRLTPTPNNETRKARFGCECSLCIPKSPLRLACLRNG